MKGVEHLIEAFGAIKKTAASTYANLKLVVVGTGDSEDHLRNLASKTPDIVFTGYIGSPAIKKLLYGNCLALVVPSLYEGLPMVILEAMASSKAVVASDVGGIPLLIEHGKNGFLVKPGDTKNLEKFVGILLEDPTLRKKMGLFGRKLVEKEFTVNKMVDRTLSVYKSLS